MSKDLGLQILCWPLALICFITCVIYKMSTSTIKVNIPN